MTALSFERVVDSLDRWEDGYLTGSPLVDFVRHLANHRIVPDTVLDGLDMYRRANARELLSVAEDLGFGTRSIPPIRSTR